LKIRDRKPYSRIGITGSPATGKKAVGKLLSDLTGLQYVSINDYAITNHFAEQVGKEYVVDTHRLRGKIDTKSKIVSGHLLPYVIPDKTIDLVVVLRCSPNVLRKRYESRKYSEKKTRENVESELIGLISAACGGAYQLRKIAEFDTSKTKPETTARKILDIIKGQKEPSFGSIDWLSTLTPTTLQRAVRGKCNRFNIPKRITRFANPKARKSRYYSNNR
jgi:adenylate kinase